MTNKKVNKICDILVAIAVINAGMAFIGAGYFFYQMHLATVNSDAWFHLFKMAGCCGIVAACSHIPLIIASTINRMRDKPPPFVPTKQQPHPVGTKSYRVNPATGQYELYKTY